MAIKNMRKPKSEEFIEQVLKHRLVLDVGGGKPWSTGWVHKKYRTILEEKGYCVDFMKESKPHIVADIKRLPFKGNSVDGIICNAVLEHVDKPFQAMNELHRILSEGGELAFYVPWIYPYHSAPCDYFRYTQDGIRSLTDRFSEVQIAPTDFYGLQPNRVLCALHLLLPPITWLNSLLFRLIGIPVYLLYRVVLYMLLYITGNRYIWGNHDLKSLRRKVDKVLVDNWTHGYWCLCRK